jgi:hypothetical protein
MRTKKKQCNHILTNGQVCNAIPMRDSNFCYWHHKARARRRRYERIGGPISMEANSGLELPLLEDANAIQVAIQEIMQAILDRRIDNKRAGLLLYSLQLASSNIRNLTPLPKDDRPQIDKIGSDDEDIFNDCIGSDERDQECHDDCRDCAEPDCDSREQGTESNTAPAILPPALPAHLPPKMPPATVRASDQPAPQSTRLLPHTSG